MEWAVDTANQDEEGRRSIGGMTTGSNELWGDAYWFELRLDDDPIVINYWGDRVIWRTDPAI